MNESKAMVLGSSGQQLTREEVEFFRGERPWGFILFARNLGEPRQIRDLVDAMRDCVGQPDAPVFIDQEGGRVQRLRPPLAPNYPSGASIGALYAADRKAGLRAAWLLARLHAFDLLRYGISVDCLPVLDVPVQGSSEIIGSRAYGRDPQSVAALGRAAANGLLAGGVLPVMKHVPGHGRATLDTHLALPTVAVPLGELRHHDFAPFKALNDLPMAMTAHVIFAAVDPEQPATTSARVIGDIVRGEIGFQGLLLSDDSSMKALSGDYRSRARAILAAGCDIVLHCNGDMAEMKEIAAGTGVLAGRSRERAASALARVHPLEAADEAALRSEFAGYFEAAA